MTCPRRRWRSPIHNRTTGAVEFADNRRRAGRTRPGGRRRVGGAAGRIRRLDRHGVPVGSRLDGHHRRCRRALQQCDVRPHHNLRRVGRLRSGTAAAAEALRSLVIVHPSAPGRVRDALVCRTFACLETCTCLRPRKFGAGRHPPDRPERTRQWRLTPPYFMRVSAHRRRARLGVVDGGVDDLPDEQRVAPEVERVPNLAVEPGDRLVEHRCPGGGRRGRPDR